MLGQVRAGELVPQAPGDAQHLPGDAAEGHRDLVHQLPVAREVIVGGAAQVGPVAPGEGAEATVTAPGGGHWDGKAAGSPSRCRGPAAGSTGRVLLPRFGCSQSPHSSFTPCTGWAQQLLFWGGGLGVFFVLFPPGKPITSCQTLEQDRRVRHGVPQPAELNRCPAASSRQHGGLGSRLRMPTCPGGSRPPVPGPAVLILTPRRAGTPRPARPAVPAAAAAASSQPRRSAGERGWWGAAGTWHMGTAARCPLPRGVALLPLGAEVAGPGGGSRWCWGLTSSHAPPRPQRQLWGTLG